MNQTSENSKNTKFGPDFAPFSPKLEPQIFLWLLLLKTNEPNLRKWKKP